MFIKLSSICPPVCLSICLSHQLAATLHCSGFAAVGPATRRYRSIAAQPALSTECKQCHVNSWCRKLSTDLFVMHIQSSSKKGSPSSITECRVPELIPVLGSQPAGDVSHKPDGRLPLLSARPAVTPQPLRRLLAILLLGEQRHNGCEQFA